MDLFTTFAILISATALLSYLNARFLRLPPTIGVMASALSASVAITVLGLLGLGVDAWAERLLSGIDFSSLLMNGMLSFLLFAGALHVELGDLLERRWSILSLATVGVVLSTLLLGGGYYFLLGLLGIPTGLLYALLFGALASPTDPIAVLGILRDARAPRGLESMVIGESLFNDGVGVVVFTMLLGFAAGGHDSGLLSGLELFVVEALGGVAVGLVSGFVAYRMLRTVDNYIVEILITLALVSGGYALAGALHTSGPIAMVVAGLFMGNHGRVFGMTEQTRGHVDRFWSLLDEILNAVLFVLIGFEVLLLDYEPRYLAAAVLVVPLALVVRFLAVALPITVLRTFRSFERGTLRVMTWGGIRGGISIALALSLPPSPQRDPILMATYAVVLFTILVQGLSLGRAVRWATS